MDTDSGVSQKFIDRLGEAHKMAEETILETKWLAIALVLLALLWKFV